MIAARWRKRLLIVLLVLDLSLVALWAFTCIRGIIPFTSAQLACQIRDGGVWLSDQKWDVIMGQAAGVQVFDYNLNSLFGVNSQMSTWTVIPFWLPVALLSGIGFLLYRVNRRATEASQSGVCRKCGYDLRETPDKCPECGTEAVVSSAKEKLD